jgi:branched-subunit amino acid transport protein AzlD
MNNEYLFWAMVVMCLCTFVLRALPFVAMKNAQDKPILQFFGRTMPPGIMLILVVYSISSINFAVAPHGAPSLISIGIVVVLHHIWRKPLLSIGLGTLAHVLMLQWF